MIVTAEEVKASAADNILQMWQHENNTQTTYAFTYDKLSRLTINKLYEGAICLHDGNRVIVDKINIKM